MLKRNSLLSRAVAFGMVLSLGLVSSAWAQAPTVGVVDEDKLAEGYKQYKEAVDSLDKKAQLLDSQIPAREFLPDEDGKGFDGLILKPTRTADEQKKLETMVKSGLDRRAEFTMLIGKATRSEDETKKMKGLQDQMTKNGPAVRKISEDLMASIRSQQDSTDAEYTNRANQVVGQVAGEKKLSLVVRKRAVVWSADSIDITTEVLTKLNK